MVHEGQEVLIKDALVFLFAAGVLVPALRGLKLPTIVGFMLAGIALGPSGFGQFADQLPVLAYLTRSDAEAVAPFAELGVLFLLFLLGLELSVEKLWALRRIVLGAGAVQVGFSTALIAGLGYALGLSAAAAICVGLALSLSSTAIIMQLMVRQRKAATPVGRTVLGVLLLQDILVAPILIFVGFAGQEAGQGLALLVVEAFAEGLIALALIFFIGRFLLRPALQLAVRAGGRDLLLALILLTIVGAALITASAGLSIALGAFLAGLLVGETEFKHQIEVDLEPFKGLLLGLFFMTVGFGLALGLLFAQWPIILAGLGALLIAKTLIAYAATRLFAGGQAVATEAAFLLAPAGEFAFIILAAARMGDVLTDQQVNLLAAIAGLSMLFIPASWLVGRTLAGRSRTQTTSETNSQDFAELQGHFIIAGFGRVGRIIAQIMEAEQADIVALDKHPACVVRQRRVGRKVYFGDASHAEILEHAGLQGAAMLVVTVDDPDKAEQIVRASHRRRPDMPILARAKDVDHARALYQAGASHVVPDAIEAGLQMAARALEDIGYEPEPARDLIAAVRDSAYRKAQTD